MSPKYEIEVRGNRSAFLAAIQDIPGVTIKSETPFIDELDRSPVEAFNASVLETIGRLTEPKDPETKANVLDGY